MDRGQDLVADRARINHAGIHQLVHPWPPSGTAACHDGSGSDVSTTADPLMASNSHSEDEEPQADIVERKTLQRSLYAQNINRPDRPDGGRDDPDATNEDAAIAAWTDAVRDAGFAPEPGTQVRVLRL